MARCPDRRTRLHVVDRLVGATNLGANRILIMMNPKVQSGTLPLPRTFMTSLAIALTFLSSSSFARRRYGCAVKAFASCRDSEPIYRNKAESRLRMRVRWRAQGLLQMLSHVSETHVLPNEYTSIAQQYRWLARARSQLSQDRCRSCPHRRGLIS